jgi:hypothetical protein
MSLSATLRRPDHGSLGAAGEICREISRAFPDTRFILIEHEPPGVSAARRRMSPLLRLWLALFGRQIDYPHYYGICDDKSGFAVEFRFATKTPISEMLVMLYESTGGVGRAFFELSAATGWEVRYPPF